jgi:hypothetical protein
MLPLKTFLVRAVVLLAAVLFSFSTCAADAPINDDFANRIQLTGQALHVSGDTTGSLEAAELPYSAVGAHSVWWTWTASETVLLQAALYSDVDAFFEMGYGDSIDAFFRQRVAVVDLPNGQHQIQFWVNAGVTYQIRVTSSSTRPGKFSFSIGKMPTIAFTQPTENELYLIPSGGQTNIDVVVNAASENGQISQVQIGNVIVTNAPYSVVVSNVVEGLHTLTAIVTDEIGITNMASVAYRVSTAAIANDNFADRATLTGESMRFTALIEGATMELGEPSLSVFSFAEKKTVWWRWVAPSSSYYDFATTGGELEIFTGSDVANLKIASVTNGTGVSVAIPMYDGAQYKRLRAQAGVEYEIRVAERSAYPPQPNAVIGISRYPALTLDGPANNEVLFALPSFSVEPLAPPRQINCVYFLSADNLIFHDENIDTGWGTGVCSPPFVGSPTWRGSGNFTCYAVATDDLGLQARSELRTFVIKDPTIVNDDFANRSVLQGTKFRLTGAGLESATMEPGEPNGVGRSLWWRWTCPVTAQYGINILRSGVGSFAVYTGDAINSLTQVVMAAQGLATNFSATAGVTYNFQMGGGGYQSSAGPTGEVRIARLPTVTIVSPQPNILIPRGGNLRIDVAASSPDSSVMSVDFFDLKLVPNEFNQYVPRLFLIQTATIPPFHLTLTNLPGTQSGLRTIVATAHDDFGFSASSELPFYVSDVPLNDFFNLRIPLAGSMIEGAASSIGATLETGEPESSSTETLWWTWTAPETGTYQATLLGEFASRMDVFTGDNVASLIPVAGITNQFPTNIQRTFMLNANAGAAYQIRLSPYPPSSSSSGPLTFQIRPTGPIPAPTVAIRSPLSNENFKTASTLTITAEATANYPVLDGGFPDTSYVASVEFFANDQSLGSVFAKSRETSTFTLTWTNRQTGQLVLTAKASDQTGVSTTSAPVTINVNLPQQIELRLVSIQPGLVQFSIVGPKDHTYSVRTSSDLINWTTVATNLPSASAIADYLEYNSGWAPAGYYQAVVEQ